MKTLFVVVAVYSIALISGCSSSSQQFGSNQSEYEAEINARNKELEARDMEIAARDKELMARDQEISELKKQLDQSQKVSMMTASTGTQQAGQSDASMMARLLPPKARAGQCFARVFSPPKYKTETEKVLKADGYDEVKITPAVYRSEPKTVLVKEATEVLEVIPAVYGWKEEKVLVSPEITELRVVPAVYATVQERVLVKPAHSVWKKGTGPITKIDESTGEIMCLVEIPAEYKTVQKRVLKTPETTKPVVVKKAVYKTVKTRVVKEPARTVTRKVPAAYDTVAVQKLVKAASTSKVSKPPVYETVKTSYKVSDGYLKWEPILCETNVTGDIIRKLQQALNTKGYQAGPVDGIYGARTTQAVRKYQQDSKIPGNGELTIELVEALNIKY
ncbi:MAG: peptidoglycan-binding protein [Gammaproteobacteria bacterium]|nr:peptidoglycan-binding protein [Gammaproteobacteria bacterium]MDH3856628.1 peptidoglycan-binding protein [Gammaproteobacteria bacterium]